MWDYLSPDQFRASQADKPRPVECNWMRAAAPTCRDCKAPVLRTEHAWHLDEDGNWQRRADMVCENGHRMVVEPLGMEET